MPTDIVVEASNVTRDFELRRPRRILRAVRGVSLRLHAGETLALVGESGSGKSTLARMLLGLLAPSAGDVYVFGEPIAKLGRAERAHLVQPVFQDPYASLNPKKRIGDIVAMPLKARGGVPRNEIAERVGDMLERVGLARSYASRFPSELSGGQRQRVAIARALIGEPKVVVCDEPTSALDVSVQAQILNLLQDLRTERALSYLIVTHNIGVVAHLADRVAVMYLGRVVEEGPTQSVLAAPQHPYTELLLSAVLPLDPDRALPNLGTEVSVSQTSLPTGCAFAPRCPRASELCQQEDPVAALRNEGFVACHHPSASIPKPMAQVIALPIPLQRPSVAPQAAAPHKEIA
ncbi:MAG: ATP-binding cassette domain-containing protein [Rhodocyclaceae bacterium]